MRRQLALVLLLVIFSPGFGLTPVGAEAGAVNLSGTWGLQYMPSRGDRRANQVYLSFQTGRRETKRDFLRRLREMAHTPPGHRRSERE
jgi:hypothetical protein